MQGPLPHREVVEESGLAIGRSASSGVSVCILPAGIHHMRHVVRQADTPDQAGLVRQTGMSPCLNGIDIGRARKLPSAWFERSQSTTAHGSPGPTAQRGRPCATVAGTPHTPGLCRPCTHPATVCMEDGGRGGAEADCTHETRIRIVQMDSRATRRDETTDRNAQQSAVQ